MLPGWASGRSGIGFRVSFHAMASMHLLVLVRDDERRERLLTLLRTGGHHAVAAPDAPAAAEAIGAPGFDAVILDLRLPDLDVGRLRQALIPSTPAEPDSLDAAERRHIALALRHTGGNKRRASQLLGISRSTLLHKVRKYGLLALALSCLAAPTRAYAQSAPPIPPGKVSEGTLSFDGHATVGDFVGTTSAVSGEISGGDSLVTVHGWVLAPVRSLSTKNKKRDRDLNKSMESDKYPTIRFDLRGVVPGQAAGDSVAVTLEGALSIHGISRDVRLPGYVHIGEETVRVRSDFPLNLKDYEIGGLSKALGLLKMMEVIEVHVDLTFAPGLQ